MLPPQVLEGLRLVCPPQTGLKPQLLTGGGQPCLFQCTWDGIVSAGDSTAQTQRERNFWSRSRNLFPAEWPKCKAAQPHPCAPLLLLGTTSLTSFFCTSPPGEGERDPSLSPSSLCDRGGCRDFPIEAGSSIRTLSSLSFELCAHLEREQI